LASCTVRAAGGLVWRTTPKSMLCPFPVPERVEGPLLDPVTSSGTG
jgi:hypothetical protein